MYFRIFSRQVLAFLEVCNLAALYFPSTLFLPHRKNGTLYWH